jgi:hypothetical protein
MALGVYTAARGISSLIVEALKAHGRPEIVTRMNAIELVVGTIAMLALLPFGLVGVCVGISIGSILRTAYALRSAHAVMGLPRRNLLVAIRPPVVAALAMVAVLLPLDLLVLHAGDRATVPGLLILAFEAVLGVAIYGGLLHLLIPGALAELRGLLGKIRRRSLPQDQAAEEQRPRQIGTRVLGPTDDLAAAGPRLGGSGPGTDQS